VGWCSSAKRAIDRIVLPEPFEDSRRLTGCNVYFDDTGAALETARGLVFDENALTRWRDNIAVARRSLGWPEVDIVARMHRSGASLAFAAPLDQLYTATEVNEWAWWSAFASPFSPREKVPEGRMRAGFPVGDEATRRKLPFDPQTLAFVRNLRRDQTDAEQLVWSYLRDRRLHGQKFRRQKTLGPYVLDFYCHELKLAIEVDGGQHNESWRQAHDMRRDAFASEHGIQTLRYWNHDVLIRTEDVLADIWNQVEARMAGTAIGQGAPSSALRAPSPGGRREEPQAQPQPQPYHAPGHAAVRDPDSALRMLRALAAAEAKPALAALRAAADARALPFLADDDAVSIGAGDGGHTWPIDALPKPGNIDWQALHAIPTALVTGSNGKTTTVRLVAAMARAHGWCTAHSCTDGVFLDGAALESGDFSGPSGARTALRQQQAQAAVLETARGGILRRGLALCRADVAVVTNIAADHFGEYGVHDLDDLVAVKLTVAHAVGNDGLLVLNADDAVLRSHAVSLSCPIGWFADDDDAPLLATHRDAGGATCGVQDGRLRLHWLGLAHDLGNIDAMPLTVGGRARYNVANIAAAALAAAALGVAPATIATALVRFGASPDDNPGRLQHWCFGATDVYVDYAHNPDGLHALMRAIGADTRRGRLAILLGHAGNREDDALRAVATTAAGYRPDLIVLKNIEGYERGRTAGQIAAIMRAALLDAGVPADAIETRPDEVDAARLPLQWVRDGDLVVLPVHESAARNAVVALLDTLRDRGWRPGQLLPPRDGADE
jgi:UDP-N-acetylmuramyl tripeptide synthase/very-short-patch-repair endonuclease